jgi:hypothetical protein
VPILAGTPEARERARKAGRANAERIRNEKRDRMITELVEAAPALTPAQRDRLATAFATSGRREDAERCTTS